MINLLLLVTALLGFMLCTLAVLRGRQQPSLVPGPVLGGLTPAVAWMFPMREKGKEELQKDMVRGGYLHESATINFLAMRNVALIAWMLFCAVVLVLELVQPTRLMLALAASVAILLFGMPRIWVGTQANSRAKRICHDLPDALDLLAMMMSGGMTMQDSLNHVIGEFDDSHNALASELRIMARHAKTGTLDHALVAFADRLSLPEVTALTALLRGGHRAGGSLVAALRSFSDGLRYERDQKAKERGNTASVKLLLPVIFCLAPPIYILLLGPAFLNLKDFIEHENRPGGALSPSVQIVTDDATVALSSSPDSFVNQ